HTDADRDQFTIGQLILTTTNRGSDFQHRRFRIAWGCKGFFEEQLAVDSTGAELRLTDADVHADQKMVLRAQRQSDWWTSDAANGRVGTAFAQDAGVDQWSNEDSDSSPMDAEAAGDCDARDGLRRTNYSQEFPSGLMHVHNLTSQFMTYKNVAAINYTDKNVSSLTIESVRT